MLNWMGRCQKLIMMKTLTKTNIKENIMRARRLIQLVEQDKETKVEAPDLSNVLDGWVTKWSGTQVEYECPTMEDGVLQVFEDRSWHWKVRGEIVESGSTYQSLAEFMKDNFSVTIEKIEDEEIE